MFDKLHKWIIDDLKKSRLTPETFLIEPLKSENLQKEGKPRGRRIGSRVYLNTKKFLEWLDIDGGKNE